MRIPLYKPFLDEEEKKNISSVIESGWLSSKGEAVQNFERKLENFLEVRKAIATDSGTSALHSALKVVGVEEGDEVIVPGFTFGATAMAVKQAEARVVPIDVEKETFGIDPDKLESKISRDTAAVIVAHLFGQPSKIEQIVNISEKYDVPVIEDAAQAFGSEYRGSKLGTFGDIGAFSFSWNKTITTGKGGAIVTQDEELASCIETFTCQGKLNGRKFEAGAGCNYRMDSLRASIGISQMEKYSEILYSREKVVKNYRDELEEIKNLEFMSCPENAKIVPWAFYILSDSRDRILEELQNVGITAECFYKPINEHGSFKSFKDLPVSKKLSEKGLVLPTYPEMTEKQVRKVSKVIEQALNSVKTT